MLSTLCNTSKSNTRLDKFLFLFILFRSVSGLAHFAGGRHQDFCSAASVACRYFEVGAKLLSGKEKLGGCQTCQTFFRIVLVLFSSFQP